MCTGSVATTSIGSGQNAILEPSGTSIVIMAEGMVSRPQAAFSLMQCSVDPFTEHFLPDIAWTLDGKYLCALTTHGQLFLLSGVLSSTLFAAPDASCRRQVARLFNVCVAGLNVGMWYLWGFPVHSSSLFAACAPHVWGCTVILCCSSRRSPTTLARATEWARTLWG